MPKASQTRGRKCPRSFGTLWFAQSRYESEETSPTTTYFATLQKNEKKTTENQLNILLSPHECEYEYVNAIFLMSYPLKLLNNLEYVNIIWVVFLFFRFLLIKFT